MCALGFEKGLNRGRDLRDFNTTPAGQWSPGTTEPVDLARTEAFRIGSIEVVPCELSLNRAGQSIHLEPKVMQVLVAFAREPGRVLSRDDLIEIVWEGRIVGDASINRALSQLRAALAELGDESVQIETLPKVGYRLLIDGTLSEAKREARTEPTAAWTKRALTASILLLVLVISSLWLWPRSDTIESIRIVMLPIEAGSPEDEFSALGFTSQLRDDLAASGGVEIVESGSAMQMLKEGRTPSQITQALGADFLISGKFVATNHGHSLTLTAYKPGVETPFWIRDLVNQEEQAQLMLARTLREIRTIAGLEPTQAKLQMPLTRDEYSDFILARGIVRSHKSDIMPVAEQILERLLKKHESFVPALVALAYAQTNLPYPPGGDPDELSRRWKRTGELLDRALELEPDNAQALGLKGFFSDGEVEERLALLKRSTELDPGNRNIMQMKAVLSLATGRATEALETYDEIIDFDPLWLRSPQGHDMAIELGRRDRAEDMMRRLRAVVTDPQQILLLDAAEARAQGDLSTAYRLLSAMDLQASDGQRSSARFYLNSIELQLGIIKEMARERPNLPETHRLLFLGELPDKASLQSLGMSTESFWADEFFREHAPRSFVASGKPRDLVAYYDEFADSPNDLLEKISNGSFDFRTVAPYLALALRKAGRDADAKQMLKLALEIDKGFTSHGAQNMGELVRSAQLYAVAGRREDAIRNLEKARSMGWPYLSAWLLVYPYLGTVDGDPAFESLRSDPRFRSLAAEVEAERQRERAEVLAQKMT